MMPGGQVKILYARHLVLGEFRYRPVLAPLTGYNSRWLNITVHPVGIFLKVIIGSADIDGNNIVPGHIGSILLPLCGNDIAYFLLYLHPLSFTQPTNGGTSTHSNHSKMFSRRTIAGVPLSFSGCGGIHLCGEMARLNMLLSVAILRVNILR